MNNSTDKLPVILCTYGGDYNIVRRSPREILYRTENLEKAQELLEIFTKLVSDCEENCKIGEFWAKKYEKLCATLAEKLHPECEIEDYYLDGDNVYDLLFMERK